MKEFMSKLILLGFKEQQHAYQKGTNTLEYSYWKNVKEGIIVDIFSEKNIHIYVELPKENDYNNLHDTQTALKTLVELL